MKKTNKILAVITMIIAIISAVYLVNSISKENVTNFDECVNVTGIVLESYPAQCVYNGKTFVEELTDEEKNSIVNPNHGEYYKHNLVQVENWKGTQEFQGRITDIQNGKDGVTLRLEIGRMDTIYTTISIPNLGENSGFDFDKIQLGNTIYVKGNAFTMENQKHLTAKQAKVIFARE